MTIDLKKLIKQYGNNYDLGQKVRELYWKNEKNLQRTRLSQA